VNMMIPGFEYVTKGFSTPRLRHVVAFELVYVPHYGTNVAFGQKTKDNISE
jgi:hypothetical protein